MCFVDLLEHFLLLLLCFLFLIIVYFEIGFLVKNHDYTVKMLPGTVHRKTKFLVNLY